MDNHLTAPDLTLNQGFKVKHKLAFPPNKTSYIDKAILGNHVWQSIPISPKIMPSYGELLHSQHIFLASMQI